MTKKPNDFFTGEKKSMLAGEAMRWGDVTNNIQNSDY
jgi:hypothetical protein